MSRDFLEQDKKGNLLSRIFFMLSCFLLDVLVLVFKKKFLRLPTLFRNPRRGL